MSRPGGFMDFLRRLWKSPGADPFPGGEGIKTLWLSWAEMTYSGETPGSDMRSRVDLSDVDRRVAVIFRDYFKEDVLHESAVADLEECEATLIQVVPSLTGDDRQYFAMALSIAQWMLEIQAGTEGLVTT
jgi:hypothetical protein